MKIVINKKINLFFIKNKYIKDSISFLFIVTKNQNIVLKFNVTNPSIITKGYVFVEKLERAATSHNSVNTKYNQNICKDVENLILLYSKAENIQPTKDTVITAIIPIRLVYM